MNRRFLIIAATTASLVGVATHSGANRGELDAFLSRAERMGRLSAPVRADITITYPDAHKDQAVLILDPRAPGRQYMQIKSTGWRSLMPLSWSDGRVVKKTGAKPEKMHADDTISGTDFRPMEFFPFWANNFQTAFISDQSRLDKTVSLYAAEEDPYSLYVITFDKAKMVPLTTKYYKDDFKTLVRIREDSDHLMVGSRPLPRKITIRDYTENSATTFELNWKLLEAVPGDVTRDESFEKASLD